MNVDRLEALACLCQFLFGEDVVVPLHDFLESFSCRNETKNDSRDSEDDDDDDCKNKASFR